MNPVRTKFVRYIPPPPKENKTGRSKNKGASQRDRRNFVQKAKYIEAFLDAKADDPNLSQDAFVNQCGTISQGLLSKWLNNMEYIFEQATNEKLKGLFAARSNTTLK